MAQELLNLLEVNANQAGWDATVNSNRQTLEEYIKTFLITISTQGDTGSGSQIGIQLQDAKGDDVNEVCFLRVRLSEDGEYVESANATMVIQGDTVVRETFTAGVDLTFESNSNGLFQLLISNSVAETFTIRLGVPNLSPKFANYHNVFDLTHAAP